MIMAIGFVLIQTTSGNERAVYARLQEIPEVKELHPLFGEYDFIAKVEAPDYDAVGRLVSTRLGAIPGISSTRTLTETRFAVDQAGQLPRGREQITA